MCAKFGSSSTTRMQRVANGALLRSSAKRGICTGANGETTGASGALATAAGGVKVNGANATSLDSLNCCGNSNVNTLPCPGVLLTLIEPPSKVARSREIDRPRPVPPYLRLVVPSAWRKASKMLSCWSAAMPIPESRTMNATRSSGWPATVRLTAPFSVNFTALDSRFLITCSSR
ncbi:hypothetical protein D3C87_1257770 [compost metagenome]